MKTNKGQNKTQAFIAELYSPIHVGSGEELKKDHDFLIESDSIFVVDVNQTINSIQSNEQVKKYCDSAKLEDLISFSDKKYGNKLQFLSKTQEHENCSSIREQIKDAFSRPYIPGSSLKGAIRTALWTETLQNSSVGKYDEKNVFGANPQKDIMKSFHVSDGYFEQENLCLGDVRIANRCDGTLKWRNLATNNTTERNQKQWNQTKGIHTEVLSEGAKAEFIFSWDDFLLNDLGWSDSSLKVSTFLKNFDQLREILNKHALRIIEDELNFFEENNLPQVSEFYKKLKNEIHKNSKSAWLRMSWGSGRSGITGLTRNLFEAKIMQNFKNSLEKNLRIKEKELKENLQSEKRLKREIKNIENILETLQPAKTRRLLVKGDSPCLPLGWIQIYPSDESVQNPYKKKSSASVQLQNNNKPQFSAWLFKKIVELKQKHNIKLDEDVLRGKPLAEEWKTISDNLEKKKIAKEIVDYWKEKDWWNSPQRNQRKIKEIYINEMSLLDKSKL